MAVKETLKNMATAAAIAAIRKKYEKPAPEKSKGDDAEKETAKLLDQLNASRLSLNTGIDRLIARAGKGGVSNAELIKTTAKLKELAKTMG
ncbi:MAG: hypothetical protein IKS96_07210 [Fibrobacter sp.]|nr:hypothetical protein [Fibrobacter sp.]MBR6449716.1 hypothetical protein [Fibrobacter sp.]